MFSRSAKTEDDLLHEQANFLKNPRSDRLVTTVASKGRSPRSAYIDETSSFPIAAINPDVVERDFCPDNEDSQNEPLCLTSSLPHVPLLSETITDGDLIRAAGRLNPETYSERGRTKSLFAKQLLKTRNGGCLSKEKIAPVSKGSKKSELPDPIRLLADTGPVTIRGQGLAANEVVRIHENNINLLSQLSAEEIMKEREAIIASTDPKVISFLMHKRSPNIGGMSEHRSDAPEHDKSDTNVHSVLSSLGIDEDSTFPHMDVVEPEKLAWMQDLPKTAKSAPDVKSADPSEKPCNARFDLEGRVVPPNADIPTHLGLHHHGEEPERGGYTIDEIFHLASSTQPSQRRIALSCLASALAASRRGRHGGALQTSSLVSPLLSAPAAVCFLLRWSLDKAVSEVTRVGAPGGSGGVSLAVVCECLRALDNLLSDGKGEILLDETFEWTPEVRAVGNCRPSLMKKPHKFHPQPYSDSEMIGEKEKDTSDHVSLMAVDPVACLFETTNLASRFAWMLSSGLGIQFPPDVVAHWLPSILLKGVRHSLPLASKIFNTPNLVGSLIETFLPMTWDNAGPLAQDNDQLSVAYGIPLPGVLKLMRVFAQRSLSQRITLVNKWNLVERCFAYLLPKASSGVLDHLPSALPTRFRVMLQVESLRCLSVCLEGVDPPTKAVEITRSTLHKLVEAGTRVHKLTLDKTSFEGLEALWLAWLSFFAKAVLPRFSEALSNAHVDQVNVWANDALEQAVSVFVSKENTNSLPISLTEIPGTLPSLTTTAFELMCLLGNQGLVTRREQIFNGSTWNAIFSHFIRYQSVLTGFPGRPSHVDVVNPMYFPSDNAEPPSLPWTRPDVELDDALLTPITVSAATPCLPDLGMATCLLYRGEEGAAATLPCLWWPPSTPTYPVAVVEPVDLATSLEAKSPSFLPLIEAAVRCCDFAKLMPWCQRLVRLKIPPIMAKGATALPHGLLAIETELMGRALLNAFSTGKQTSNDDLWWTSLCLLPCLFFGQEARLLDIIRRLVFPPDALTPVERDFPAEFASTSAPWPPVHENFPTALAHHAHCVYTAYFVDLLQRSADAPLPKYQALEFRPACDFILPDDWFYMPLLECYFLRNCRLAGKACGDDHVSAGALDPETYPVKATACLGWIRGLLKYFPPSRHPKVGCLSAGAHFTRICCAILACHNAGALCFNTSGAVIGDLLGLLVPFVDLSDLDQRPETYLPLDMLSFYDLFIELVEHFAGVSYSAPIFSNILLLFLQTSSLPANYRRALWGEHQTALRALVISPREYILSAASYKGLFEPVEGDEGVLRSYASALCSGLIQPCRQPILALIAIHHLNRNIYSLSAKAEHASFLSQLSSSLKFIASRGSPEAVQMLDYLRRYKAPVVPNSPAIPISQLSNSNYTSIGCAKVTDLMQLYEENELPPLRIKRWDEFMQ